mmetsp:Transcript_67912/g.147929  ORF Transcript_67912/g.147929 Transcript_67912/m.147929 type:complete len:375 (-) Transcript_67912:109-1233(-)
MNFYGACLLAFTLTIASEGAVLIQLQAAVQGGEARSNASAEGESRPMAGAASDSLPMRARPVSKKGEAAPFAQAMEKAIEVLQSDASGFNGTTARNLIIDGCSGSSYLMGLSFRLMQAHGELLWPVGEGGSHKPDLMKKMFQLVSPEEKEVMEGADLTSALRMAMHAANGRRNHTLLFKTNSRFEGWEPSFQSRLFFLKKNRVKSVFVLRRNLLDWNICRVRDCFDGGFCGWPVDEEGNPDQSCFSRRKDSSIVTKAHLKPKELASKMKQDFALRAQTLKEFKRRGLVTDAVYTEDLLKFEHGSHGLDVSIATWRKVLVAWGLQPDPAIIEKLLISEPLAGRLLNPPAHSESIANIEEVVQELRMSDLGRYLRL